MNTIRHDDEYSEKALEVGAAIGSSNWTTIIAAYKELIKMPIAKQREQPPLVIAFGPNDKSASLIVEKLSELWGAEAVITYVNVVELGKEIEFNPAVFKELLLLRQEGLRHHMHKMLAHAAEFLNPDEVTGGEVCKLLRMLGGGDRSDKNLLTVLSALRKELWSYTSDVHKNPEDLSEVINKHLGSRGASKSNEMDWTIAQAADTMTSAVLQQKSITSEDMSWECALDLSIRFELFVQQLESYANTVKEHHKVAIVLSPGRTR